MPELPCRHGSQADKLLVLAASDNALCISCHEKLRPGQWGEAGHTHPINALLSTDVQTPGDPGHGNACGFARDTGVPFMPSLAR